MRALLKRISVLQEEANTHGQKGLSLTLYACVVSCRVFPIARDTYTNQGDCV